LLYCKCLRELKIGKQAYSNDLHEALLAKNNTAFWRTWRYKFNKSARCGQVDGCVDADAIDDKSVSHFRKAFICNNPKTAE